MKTKMQNFAKSYLKNLNNSIINSDIRKLEKVALIIKKSLHYAKRYKNVEILWASTREAYNFTNAKQLGCHIITVPPSIIEKIIKFGSSFSTLTISTVKAFLADSKKSKFKLN